MNLIGRILILVTITGILSYGLVAFVNSTSTNSGFQQDENSQRFQANQTDSSFQFNGSRPQRFEGGIEGERERGSVDEIGKGLGIMTLITLVVVLIQKGIEKLPHRKQIVSGQ